MRLLFLFFLASGLVTSAVSQSLPTDVSLTELSAEELEAEAQVAYGAERYAEAGRLYQAALDAGSTESSTAYNGACSFALAGQTEPAIELLQMSADLGFMKVDLLGRDTDLDSIRDHPRWPAIEAQMKRTAAAHERMWNSEAMRTPYAENLSDTEKVAGLARLWAETKYNFVNFDLVEELDWDSLFVASIPRVQATTSTAEYYQVMQHIVAQLKDGHSNVYSPFPLADVLRARPAFRTRLVGDQVVVAYLQDSTLADQGIRVGQEVLEIDGTPVHEYAAAHVRPYQSASTLQDLDVRTYEYALLAGDASKPIALTLREPDGTVVTREVWRETNEERRAADRSSPPFELKWLPGNVAHVAVNSFSSSASYDAYMDAYDEIVKASAIVFDVRNNGGGNSGYGWNILCTLTDAGTVQVSSWYTRMYRPAYRAWGRQEGIDGEDENNWGCAGGQHYAGPVAVLTSPRTFSAAEDFAVVFDAMDRGLLVGEKTGGSTGQPLFFELPGGGGARVTTKRDRYPDGRDFVGVGIIPDIAVAPTVESLRAGTDPVLDAAIEAVQR
ncbi:MAG: S41 family peptidase [Bacteroidota bacterium]